MKREAERKEQERKKSPKVDFVSGGSQAGITATAQKATLPSPGAHSLILSSLHHSKCLYSSNAYQLLISIYEYDCFMI